MKEESKFYHNFTEQELDKKGFVIKSLNEEYMNNRLDECMNFVNNILNEYKESYNFWDLKTKEYFLNPLDRKWDYSFVIEDKTNDIAFIQFASIYENKIHRHLTLTKKNYRSLGLIKLHQIKLCQLGIDNGFKEQEAFCDLNNNGSLIVFLKMGFKITGIRKEVQASISGDLKYIRDTTFRLYQKEKK
ncbi:MAG: GNAT family N-acetyltransferase [Ignavibacteriaceae bacterium]